MKKCKVINLEEYKSKKRKDIKYKIKKLFKKFIYWDI